MISKRMVMKKAYAIAILLMGAGITVFAQKSEPFPDKKGTDSVVRVFPKLNQSFEQANPGATIINRTNRGTIYNMPLDNMAVLVPGMNTVEIMPGSSPRYQPAPPSKMPNPLYHLREKKPGNN